MMSGSLELEIDFLDMCLDAQIGDQISGLFQSLIGEKLKGSRLAKGNH